MIVRISLQTFIALGGKKRVDVLTAWLEACASPSCLHGVAGTA